MPKGHVVVLEDLLKLLQDKKITKILDAGSGRTSLGAIVAAFPGAQVDAVVYPGDDRKLKTIRTLLTEQIRVLERDICRTSFEDTYDFVTVHLLLAEAGKFGSME